MSQENVDVVLRSIQAFEQDTDAFRDLLYPEIEWYAIEEAHIPTRGLEPALGIRRRWLENWEGHQVDVEEVKDDADSVIVCLHLTGRGKGSGVDVDLRLYMHFKVRDGKIAYIYEYADRDEALEAAGLSD